MSSESVDKHFHLPTIPSRLAVGGIGTAKVAALKMPLTVVAMGSRPRRHSLAPEMIHPPSSPLIAPQQRHLLTRNRRSFIFSSTGAAAANGTAAQSVSGNQLVAIDSKIEQAMDLVKTHLMFAVREEVEVLRARIVELETTVVQLEAENAILREHVPQDILQNLALQGGGHFSAIST